MGKKFDPKFRVNRTELAKLAQDVRNKSVIGFPFNLNNLVENIVKNTLVRTFYCFQNQFEISFQIKPTSITTGISSILHLTARSDNHYMGDRVPAVFFYPGTTRLEVCTAIGGNRNYCFTTQRALPMNQFTMVDIRQIKDKLNGAFLFTISINGTQVISSNFYYYYYYYFILYVLFIYLVYIFQSQHF